MDMELWVLLRSPAASTFEAAGDFRQRPVFVGGNQARRSDPRSGGEIDLQPAATGRASENPFWMARQTHDGKGEAPSEPPLGIHPKVSVSWLLNSCRGSADLRVCPLGAPVSRIVPGSARRRPTCGRQFCTIPIPVSRGTGLRITSRTLTAVSSNDTRPSTRAPKHRRKLEAIFEDPARSNIARRDIDALLEASGAEINEGAGSRVRIVLNGIRAVFHRPHPHQETDRGAVRSMRRFLTEAGVTP